MVPIRPLLLLQVLLLAGAAYVVLAQLWAFPFPSPAARLFLGPKERWPERQVMAWVEGGNPHPGFVAFFNRDPERTVPPGPGLVSPADGVVKGIFTRDDVDYFTVGLSFWDVHVVRTPLAGVVQDVETIGTSLYKNQSETADLAYLRGKAAPVQTIVTIANDDLTFKVRLITSYWASRLRVWATVGERLEKGQRIGRILMGSSVVVDLPRGLPYCVGAGERIVAGETTVAGRPCAR